MVVASNGIVFTVQFVTMVKLVKNLKGLSTHTPTKLILQGYSLSLTFRRLTSTIVDVPHR